MSKFIMFTGGFHNSLPIRMKVDEKKWEQFKSGGVWMRDVFSKNQLKRIERHFCGIKGCTCGSFERADYIEL